jgi:hypothetical protein
MAAQLPAFSPKDFEKYDKQFVEADVNGDGKVDGFIFYLLTIRNGREKLPSKNKHSGWYISCDLVIWLKLILQGFE